MNLKSQKGYSLVEIGVGIIVITLFLGCSISLFNGCYNTYRLVEQRNYAIHHALNAMETALQTDMDDLMGEYVSKEKIDAFDASGEELLEGKYAVPEDKVVGGFKDSIDTNNMRITTKIRRIPTDGTIMYDNTVLRISVTVEYTIKPVKNLATLKSEDILTYELNTIRVTNSREGV